MTATTDETIDHLRPDEDVVLRLEHLVVEYPTGGGQKVHAVSDVSFDVVRGETLGLVGESGCGKSTTGKAIMQLTQTTSGSVAFAGQDLTALSAKELRKIRPKLQMIFQDPMSSLNPRRRVVDVVGDPLVVWGRKDEREKLVPEILDTVGLDASVVGDRRPHQFSGGQCQRISIARALVLNPEVLICDEPVSALDVSVQAQILNLLEDLKVQYGLTMVFISHDLGVVRNISDRVAVMYLGKLCELAPTHELYDSPAHPYSLLLLSSIPSVENYPAINPKTTELPSPIAPPSGCRFHTRCPFATEECVTQEPAMREVTPGHWVACHHPIMDSTVPVSPAASQGN